MASSNESCYLCGVAIDHANRTMDHVPPKGLFPRPLPSDLITVPCCLRCNREKSREEEFFRLITTLGIARTPEAEAVYEQRTLRRTIHRGRLKAEIAKMISTVAHQWMEVNGVIVLTPSIHIPIAPLRAVAERTARGLTAHFHPSLEVHRLHFRTCLKGGRLLEAFALFAENLRELRLGGRTFHAYHGTTTESESVGIWLMTFHEIIPAIVLHYDASHAAQMKP